MCEPIINIYQSQIENYRSMARKEKNSILFRIKASRCSEIRRIVYLLGKPLIIIIITNKSITKCYKNPLILAHTSDTHTCIWSGFPFCTNFVILQYFMHSFSSTLKMSLSIVSTSYSLSLSYIVSCIPYYLILNRFIQFSIDYLFCTKITYYLSLVIAENV